MCPYYTETPLSAMFHQEACTDINNSLGYLQASHQSRINKTM